MEIKVLSLLEAADLVLSFSFRSTEIRENVGTFNLESQNLSRCVLRNYRGTRIDRNYIHEFGISSANRECIIHKQETTPVLATGCKCQDMNARHQKKDDTFFATIIEF